MNRDEEKQAAIDEMVELINQGRPLIIWALNQHPIGAMLTRWKVGRNCDITMDQPITVRRESTFEEWRQTLPRDMPGADVTELHAYHCGARFFYEVTLD